MKTVTTWSTTSEQAETTGRFRLRCDNRGGPGWRSRRSCQPLQPASRGVSCMRALCRRIAHEFNAHTYWRPWIVSQPVSEGSVSHAVVFANRRCGEMHASEIGAGRS